MAAASAPITAVTGPACPLGLDNVDTDQLCPARFMKRRRSQGYGDAFLHDLRFASDGSVRANPVDEHPGAVILLAGRNFGAGSSREAAVYATLDAGFRAVVAPGFGDILAASAARNGLVPARVSAQDAAALLAAVRAAPDAAVTVDLAERAVWTGGLRVPFEIDETRRTMLMNGWDDADVTATHATAIAAFVERDRALRPWALKVTVLPMMFSLPAPSPVRSSRMSPAPEPSSSARSRGSCRARSPGAA